MTERTAKGLSLIAGELCQVADPSVKLDCSATESGGLRCEVSGRHERHRISEHTTRHALSGNGYRCTAI